MDREAWRAAVQEVAKSRTQLSDWTELGRTSLWSEMLVGLWKSTRITVITDRPGRGGWTVTGTERESGVTATRGGSALFNEEIQLLPTSENWLRRNQGYWSHDSLPQLPANASHSVQPRKMSFPKGRVRVENDPKDQTKYHVHSVCSEECICIMAIVRVLMKKLSLRSGKFIDVICLIFLKPLRRASLFSHDIANKRLCVFTDTFLIPAHQLSSLSFF